MSKFSTNEPKKQVFNRKLSNQNKKDPIEMGQLTDMLAEESLDNLRNSPIQAKIIGSKSKNL